MLQNSLDSIQNVQFIEVFKNKFFNDVLVYNKYYLKQILSENNPLLHLINIDKQLNGKNKLVKNFIDRATSLIEVTNEDILREAFYNPSRQNLIYIILFNQSFKSSQLYTDVINRLITQWKQWTAEGVRLNDVLTWKNFSHEQLNIVHEIWMLVTKTENQKLQIDALFEANQREIQAKLEMKDKIVTCLNAYCEHAIDKDIYHEQIRQWYSRFEREIIKSIQIPKILQNVLSFADKLNPYANARNWREFLARKFRKRLKYVVHKNLLKEFNIQMAHHRQTNQVCHKYKNIFHLPWFIFQYHLMIFKLRLIIRQLDRQRINAWIFFSKIFKF